MLVSAIVITVQSALRRQVEAALSARPGVTLGAPHGDRLPVVIESSDPHAGRDTFSWIEALAGVMQVRLVAWEQFGEGGQLHGAP